MTNSKIWNGITNEDYNKMMQCFSPVTKSYKKGSTVCDYGEKTNFVGIVESGNVSVVRLDINGNNTILEELSEGDIFGEVISFSGVGDDSVFVIAQSNCKIMFINYNHITKRCSNACTHHSLLVQNMFSLISKRALFLSERVEILSRRTTREKLLSYFNIYSCKAKSKAFKLPYSLSELADYICVDRSAMMRELKKLKEENIIDSQGRNIFIK